MGCFRTAWIALTMLAMACMAAIDAGYAQPAAVKAKTIVCFGDSITAGYGLDAEQSYPAALERLLAERKYGYRVVNQGVSGNTTKDAVARVDAIVARHPDLVIVEFGGNDGLRGLSPAITQQNLDSVVSALKKARIQVLLLGITLPRNYGPEYIQAFDTSFREVAAKYRVPLKPMLYDGIYSQPGAIQSDGIHPTAKGSQLIAEHLLPLLLPLLRK